MATGLVQAANITPQRQVQLHRQLHEVPTEDGAFLVASEKRPVEREARATVLLVHGLAQNRYSWTLPDRSFEHFLVAEGFSS